MLQRLHATNIFTADGVRTDWAFQFDGVAPDNNSGTTPYLYGEDVLVQEIYRDASGAEVIVERQRELIAPNTVRVLGAPIAAGHTVKVFRNTQDRYPLVDYRDRQTVSEFDLDLAARQVLYVAMETKDIAELASDVADQSRDLAEQAVDTADEAKALAQQAVATANQANSTADAANATAGRAEANSVEATRLATLADQKAEEVKIRADAAEQSAADAAASAAQAAADAQTAVDTANGIDSKAQTALDQSSVALSTANQANATALGIDAKATQALSTANTANATANSASATANAVDGKAQTALDNAASAVAAADAANSTASSASATANSAHSMVTALRKITVAESTGNADNFTDFNSLRNFPGKWPTLLGGAPGSRNPNHPDGQVPFDGTNGVSDFYWVETFVHDGLAYQKAYPHVYSGLTTNRREKYRNYGVDGWTAWQGVGKPIADQAQLNAQVYAAQGDAAVLAQVNAKYEQPKITKSSASATNGFLCLVDGQLYGACGNGASYPTGYATARLDEAINGMMHLSRIYIPFGSKVVDFGVLSNAFWALTADGSLYTWGENTFGQLGLGHNVSPVWVPTLSATGVAKVFSDPTSCDTAGEGRGCRLFFLSYDGNVYGTGWNGQGALALGDTAHRNAWTKITFWGPNTVKNLWNLGSDVGCVFLQSTDNRLYAAGYNGHGQFGSGSVAGAVSTWVDVTDKWGGTANIAKLVKITGGFGYYDSGGNSASTVVALFTDSIRLCGANQYGQCGDGTTVGRTTPFVLPGSWADVVVQGGGAPTVYAIGTDGSYWAWGYNGAYEVGNGGSTSQITPLRINLSGLSATKLLSNSHKNNYGYQTGPFVMTTSAQGNYDVWYNGPGQYGEGGNGSKSTATTPQRVLLPFFDCDGSKLVPKSISSMGTMASAQGANTFVLTTEAGFLWAWGYNGANGITWSTSSSVVSRPIDIPLPWRVK